jgi:hypothetical protein
MAISNPGGSRQGCRSRVDGACKPFAERTPQATHMSKTPEWPAAYAGAGTVGAGRSVPHPMSSRRDVNHVFYHLGNVFTPLGSCAEDEEDSSDPAPGPLPLSFWPAPA